MSIIYDDTLRTCILPNFQRTRHIYSCDYFDLTLCSKFTTKTNASEFYEGISFDIPFFRCKMKKNRCFFLTFIAHKFNLESKCMNRNYQTCIFPKKVRKFTNIFNAKRTHLTSTKKLFVNLRTF